jgi:hypothetical protein
MGCSIITYQQVQVVTAFTYAVCRAGRQVRISAVTGSLPMGAGASASAPADLKVTKREGKRLQLQARSAGCAMDAYTPRSAIYRHPITAY